MPAVSMPQVPRRLAATTSPASPPVVVSPVWNSDWIVQDASRQSWLSWAASGVASVRATAVAADNRVFFKSVSPEGTGRGWRRYRRNHQILRIPIGA